MYKLSENMEIARSDDVDKIVRDPSNRGGNCSGEKTISGEVTKAL